MVRGNSYNMALNPAVRNTLQTVGSGNSYEFVGKMVVTKDGTLGKVWADSSDGKTLTLDTTPDAETPTFIDVPTESVRLVQDLRAVLQAITQGSWYTNSKACRKFVESEKPRWCTVVVLRNTATLYVVGTKQALNIYHVSDSTARAYNNKRYKLHM